MLVASLFLHFFFFFFFLAWHRLCPRGLHLLALPALSSIYPMSYSTTTTFSSDLAEGLPLASSQRFLGGGEQVQGCDYTGRELEVHFL